MNVDRLTRNERDVLAEALSHYLAPLIAQRARSKRGALPADKEWRQYQATALLAELREW